MHMLKWSKVVPQPYQLQLHVDTHSRWLHTHILKIIYLYIISTGIWTQNLTPYKIDPASMYLNSNEKNHKHYKICRNMISKVKF